MIRLGKRRLLSLFMAVCMVFTLLPMNNMRAMADESWTEGLQADEAGTEGYNEGGDEAKTASGPAITMITDGAVEYYDLWVGGIQVTSENKDNITGSGIEKGTVTYDPDNCILTLNGATIKGSKSDEISGTIYKYGIWFWGYLKINLMGSNEIIDESGSNTISYGIYTTHTLTITGSGSLNVSVSTTGSTSLCYGIKGTTGTIIDGGNINVSVQSDGDATGICGDNVTISGGIVTSNATTASSEVDFVNAIYAEKNINISGGTVIATGTKMNGSYPAAYGFGGSNVNITGGTVTAKAYGYNGNSDIAAVNAKFTFSNGSVKAGTDSDGSVLNDYDNSKLSKYRYLSYEISPEAASVNEAKRVIEGGIYTMAQEDAGTSESVREGLARHINGLSAMRETGIAVTADDITINYYTSAIAGTSDSPAGKDGSFIFTVSLSNEGATATTAFIRGTIIATAYAGLTDDQAVADAKEIIERATYTMIQSVANTVESARRELAEQINGLSGMDETEIIVTEKDITIESFTPAEEGTSTNLAGIDGIFTFTVKLNKGRETATTESIEVTITVTAYTGLTDEEAVAAAMEIVVGGTVAADYDADQEAKTAAVQKYVNGLLTGDLAEVTAVVSHNGNNSYKVKFTKGSVNREKEITMNIVTGYQLWVGGIRVTEENKNKITGDGIDGTVTYDPESKTLTLKDAIITGAKSEEGRNEKCSIWADDILIIILIGINEVTGGDESGIKDCYGIYAKKGLTISGTGRLNMDVSVKNHASSRGIYGNNVTIKSGTVNISANGVNDIVYGIDASNVTIKGGNVTVKAKNDFITYGILADYYLTVEGGTVNATATTSHKSFQTQGLRASSIRVTGGTVTARAYGSESNSKIGAIYPMLTFSNGKVKASTDPEGIPGDYNPSEWSSYRYISYESDPGFEKINEARDIIESGKYTMTQKVANTESEVMAELISQINGLSGMSKTGATVIPGYITIDSFTAAKAGTSANPAGTDGSFTFTAYLTRGEMMRSTVALTGTITAIAYNGLSDDQAVAAAKNAVVGGIVTVNYDADQSTKTKAVQSYVNSLLIADTAEVTAVVSHENKNTYKVNFSKGSVKDEKYITIIEGYELWVGGVQVTEENKNNITGAGIDGTVIYAPESKTLTLYNATITGTKSGEGNDRKSRYGIYSNDVLNINLIGNNAVNGVNMDLDSCTGIYTESNLKISGTGSLTVNIGSESKIRYGCGLKGSDISIKSGTVNVSVKSTYTSIGMDGKYVTITGGKITANVAGEMGNTYGIYANYTITIDGGVVGATSTAKSNFNLFASTAYCLYGNIVSVTGGTVTAKAYRLAENVNAIAIGGYFAYSNGTVKAGTDSDGADQYAYDPSQLSTYRYIYYVNFPEVITVNEARNIIEGVTYTMTQEFANTRESVKEELARQINDLPGMYETGITVTADNIIIGSFTAAKAGTSANPDGTEGIFTFTANLSKAEVTRTTVSIKGTITATAFTGITDVQAVAAAMEAVNDGTVTVNLGADQAAKIAAVQEYVNGFLTGDAAEVTAVVSHKSDNTYHVVFTKGSVNDNKDITMQTDIGYPLWVGGIQVTSANKDNIKGDGITGSVTYNPNTETLTLNNAVITGVKHKNDAYGHDNTYSIYTETGLNIVLNGNNSITGAGERAYGIYNNSGNTMTISGTGGLDMKIGNDSNIQSRGIYSVGNMKILGGNISVSVRANSITEGISSIFDVDISGGIVEVYATGGTATGIYGSISFRIENATVKTTVSSDKNVKGLVGYIEIKSGEISVVAESNKEAIGFKPINETQSIIIYDGVINVSAICYDMFCTCRKASDPEITLELSDEKQHLVSGDKERLRQIILILLDNAMNYGKDGKQIAIRAYNKKNYTVVEVEDHGHGITDEDKAQVFDRFYQGNQSRTDKKHFGLGLSIAKELVELHGGDIKVKDTPGGGATFVFRLPVCNS